MTSVLYGSGLNYQGSNPIGIQVRNLRLEVEELKKQVEELKKNAAGATAPAATLTPSVIQGPPGPPGPKGDKGDKGEKGDPGPMAYIAMPPQMMTAAVPTPVVAPAPTAAAVLDANVPTA